MNNDTYTKIFATADDMQSFAAKCSQQADKPLLIFLQGDLGAGKTTFARGWLQGLGYKGKVKSPTYSLIEPYQIHGENIYHLDLYRLSHIEELEFIGIRDYLSQTCLIEWPERAQAVLPEPDIYITIAFEKIGRQLIWHGVSKKGKQLMKDIRIL